MKLVCLEIIAQRSWCRNTLIGFYIGLGIALWAGNVACAGTTEENNNESARRQVILEALKERMRQRMRLLPKVQYELVKMTVYTDAITTELIVTNNTDMPLRVYLLTEFATIRFFQFQDEEGNRWEIPERQGFYSWPPPNQENSPLIEPKKQVRLLLVDVADNVGLRPAQGVKKVREKQPRFLKYTEERRHSLLRKDLSAGWPFVSVHLLCCKGHVRVEWRNHALPEGNRAKVLPLHPE